MHVEAVDLGQDPAHRPVPAADQDAEGVEVPKKTEAQARAGADEVKHLRRVEELLEASQEADALVVARLGVDEHEQGRAALRTHRLPGLVRPDAVQRRGRQGAYLGRAQRAALPVGGSARGVHARAAPQAAPVQQAQHRPARLVADGALGGHGEVALHPLVGHDDVPILVLDDVLPDRGERRPLAVADRLGRAALVRLALADAAAESVGSDA